MNRIPTELITLLEDLWISLMAATSECTNNWQPEEGKLPLILLLLSALEFSVCLQRCF